MYTLLAAIAGLVLTWTGTSIAPVAASRTQAS